MIHVPNYNTPVKSPLRCDENVRADDVSPVPKQLLIE